MAIVKPTPVPVRSIEARTFFLTPGGALALMVMDVQLGERRIVNIDTGVVGQPLSVDPDNQLSALVFPVNVDMLAVIKNPPRAV